MFILFERYFRLAADARDAGKIDILTMGDVQRTHTRLGVPAAQAA